MPGVHRPALTSPGPKVKPKLSTLISPPGFSTHSGPVSPPPLTQAVSGAGNGGSADRISCPDLTNDTYRSRRPRPLPPGRDQIGVNTAEPHQRAAHPSAP